MTGSPGASGKRRSAVHSEPLRRLRSRLPEPVKRTIRRRLLDTPRARFRKHLRPMDVFLVGHPKSGNTWLAYMLAIALRPPGEHQEITVKNISRFVPVMHGAEPTLNIHRRLPNPRIFRNEWPKYPDLYPRTLYLVRDPRAVLVSYFHHFRTVTNDYQAILDRFVTRYLEDGCIRSLEPQIIRWDRQVAEWKKRARRQPVMLVRYEDLHQDRQGTLSRVLSFCQASVAPEAVHAAVERGSFEAMRSQEEQHGAEAYPQTPGERFYRRGLTEGWRDELSPDARTAIEREFRPMMEALGYSPAS